MSAVFAVVGAQGVWSSAKLSVGRSYLTAACAGNVSVFAGGIRTGGGVGESSRRMQGMDCF
jgi:hypothetical protein